MPCPVEGLKKLIAYNALKLEKEGMDFVKANEAPLKKDAGALMTITNEKYKNDNRLSLHDLKEVLQGAIDVYEREDDSEGVEEVVDACDDDDKEEASGEINLND